MSGFMERHVGLDMLGLVALETISTFLIVAVAISGDTGFGPRGFGMALTTALAAAAVSSLLGVYRPALFSRTRALVVNTGLGGLLAFPAAWVGLRVFGLTGFDLLSHDRLWPARTVLVWLAAVFVIRFGFLLAIRSRLLVRRVALLGEDLAETAAVIRATRDGFLEATRPSDPDPVALRRGGIRLAVASAGFLGATSHDAFARAGVTLESKAEFWERQLRRVAIDGLTPAWFAPLDARRPRRLDEALIRAIDVGGSLLLLAVALPVMMVTVAAIWIEDRGPILYRQERAGLGGRPFTLLKFRSMRADAEARGPVWAQQADPRVTRVGAVIRLIRVDELPQLLNVLRGEMSLVGPRPERPHFAGPLAKAIPFYAERGRVRPGLTGWAQVNAPYGASIEDARVKLSYDLFYVRQRSALFNLLVLLATVRVVLFQEGAR